MPSRRNVLSLPLAALAFLAAVPASAQQTAKLDVVATFSIVGDLVREVGGDRIELATLVGPDGDAHVYAPTPTDARRLAEAKMVFMNGLGFEGWMSRLVRSSGTRALTVEAAKGVTTITTDERHAHPGVDPHAWQNIANAKVYVANIRDALIAADPAGKDTYAANAAAYLAKLDALEQEVREVIAKVPADRRRVITSHAAFGYFQDAYGVRFTAPQGVSTEAEASAKDVAAIITQIKKQKIPAVFLENVTDPRLVQQIARETGAKIGGTLYSDALTDAKGDATTYIDLIRHNLKQLAAALES